ncbi:hypothetical protein NQ318_000990 [Aromia moschata]|uniref:Uncharacterized protein n=1 Tax=Aromia moschata TaxID=1265417 RepID=A0AAV8ZGL4_9CUCU|nr:hypothetical protein NQ318_000990 [Aromia moschata]
MQNIQIALSHNPQLVRLSPNLEKLVMLKIYQNQDVQKLPKIKRLTLCLVWKKTLRTTVLRILRKQNYHPYKFQLVQELNEDDPDRRLQFCETMMNLCQTNPNLHQQIQKHILNIRRN